MKKTKIYLVENCYGGSNKVYIGKTVNSRKSSHKKIFGVDIKYNYIDEVNSLLHKDWKPLECYWIDQFKSWGFEVLNKNKGGGGPTFRTKEFKLNLSEIIKNHPTRGKKISEAKKGKPKPENWMNSILKQKISKSKKGKKYSPWKWNTPSSIKRNEKISKANKGKTKPEGFGAGYKIPIIQYDLKGNFIREWDSATEASKTLNKSPSAISECCQGKRKSAYKYVWKIK